MSIGKKLKDEREKQGVSLDEVAEATKIRKLYLNALEEEQYQELPQRVYATGFVANYARFLHLDADQVVQQFKSEAYPGEPVVPNVAARKRKVRKRIVRPGAKKNRTVNNIIAAAVFLVVIWWLGTYIAGYITEQALKSGTPDPAPPVSQEVLAPGPGQNEAVPETARQVEGIVLKITARQDCWLEVSADGISAYAQTMPAGTEQTFNARDRVAVRAGNAGGIELNLNGRQLAPLGTEGQVVVKEYTLSDVKSN
ncbi:MAG: helix-turn-helix domain-containing protein [Syntrophomonadaceae bacterium]|nr:helix-turn-helix domain-containing protein [Syntrophomonadaceae bacterium]